MIHAKNAKLSQPLTCAMLVLLLPFFAGCAPGVLPPPETARQTVILYFADEQAEHLVPEERSLEPAGRDLAVAVLEELIKGPAFPAHKMTIPADAKVLGVKIEGGIATADFSAELRTSHWGGSSGELFTVYSIVHTLAELPEVEQVQIRIEGEIVETLAGHLDLSKPLRPDPNLGAP